MAGIFSLTFTACTKKHAFTYSVECPQCQISYFDTEGRFVAKEAVTGSKSIEIEVAQFTAVQISAQSTVCVAGSPCDSVALAADLIKVELKKGDKVECTQSKSGEAYQAVSCVYIWEK